MRWNAGSRRTRKAEAVIALTKQEIVLYKKHLDEYGVLKNYAVIMFISLLFSEAVPLLPLLHGPSG